MVARRLVWIADRAVATIVVSIELMNKPTATIAKIRWREGPGSPGVRAATPTESSIATVVSLPNDPRPGPGARVRLTHGGIPGRTGNENRPLRKGRAKCNAFSVTGRLAAFTLR